MVIGGTQDADGDQLGGPLAVGRDLSGQLAADGLDAGRDGRVLGRVKVNHVTRRRSLTGGQKNRRVVGRGIGVDGHLVKGGLDGGEKGRVGSFCGKRRVARHHAEHGCHVGLDHARALDKAAQVNGVLLPCLGGQGAFEGGLFGHGVGGHDGHGGVVRGLGSGAQKVGRGGHTRLERGKVKLLANDAGRGNKDVRSLAAHDLGHKGRGLLGDLKARLAGGGVGVARVQDHGAGLTVSHVGARDGDGSRAKAVGREGGGGAGQLVGDNKSHVKALGVLPKAGVNACGLDAGCGADASLAGSEAKGLGRVVGNGNGQRREFVIHDGNP